MFKGSSERCCTWGGAFSWLLVLALGLRLANAAWGSLKLDDFHSLFHARAPSLGEFFAVLFQDNHPPLSFLLLRVSRAIFGESLWALRLPAFLAGMGTLLLTWRIAARLPCGRGRIAATLLLALSTLHVELSTDVRMYALLALASAGLLDGLLTRLEDGRGAWRITLWTVVGLHTHYHFLYVLVSLGFALLVLGVAKEEYRVSLRACLVAFAVAAALSAPWYGTGFRAQLGHDLAPGGSNATPLRLLEGIKNLVYLNISVADGSLRSIGLAASALLLVVALLGTVSSLRRFRDSGPSAVTSLLAASALMVPILTWAAAQFTPRAGYEWRYLAGTLPAFCLLVGAEACAIGWLARSRRIAVLLLMAFAVVLVIPNVRDPGEEDYRGAIEWILDNAEPGDAVVAADWQPQLFPHALVWEYYAPRLADGRPIPKRLAYNDDFALIDPGEAATHRRVFCCLRSVPAECALLRGLRYYFPEEESQAFGRSVYVHLFTRP